jgi:hypothetical protein
MRLGAEFSVAVSIVDNASRVDVSFIGECVEQNDRCSAGRPKRDGTTKQLGGIRQHKIWANRRVMLDVG